MSPVLHLDLETRSAADLKKVGAHRYAEDPTTRILCGSYRFDDGPVKRWIGHRPDYAVIRHIEEGGTVCGHNAIFERSVLNASGALGAVSLEPEQQDCTMARGLAHGLPASLDALGTAIKAPITKDKDGHRLMLKLCKACTAEPTPEELARLAAYCDQDVEAECAIDARVPALSERERQIWILDQRMNDRGFRVDVPTVAKAQAVVEYAKKRADERMWRLTNGAISTCNQTAKIVDFLAARGIACTSVADGETDELIAQADIFDDQTAIDILNLRRTSVKAFKFPAMLAAACRDQRVRGSMAYHGAHTGRWAGRVVQPQNFKRLDEDAGDPEKVKLEL